MCILGGKGEEGKKRIKTYHEPTALEVADGAGSWGSHGE